MSIAHDDAIKDEPLDRRCGCIGKNHATANFGTNNLDVSQCDILKECKLRCDAFGRWQRGPADGAGWAAHKSFESLCCAGPINMGHCSGSSMIMFSYSMFEIVPGPSKHVNALEGLVHEGIPKRNVSNGSIVANGADCEADTACIYVFEQHVLAVVLDTNTVVLVPNVAIMDPNVAASDIEPVRIESGVRSNKS